MSRTISPTYFILKSEHPGTKFQREKSEQPYQTIKAGTGMIK